MRTFLGKLGLVLAVAAGGVLSAHAQPKEPVKPAVEDLQLKKALEILGDKSQAARSGE